MFGASVGAAGDLDHDGVSDVFVTDPWARDAGGESSHGMLGAVWIVSGRNGAVLRRLRGRPGTEFGCNAVGIGDSDGDGVLDLAVESRLDGAPSWGEIQIVSGATGEVLYERNAQSLQVGPIGDFDGDGKADVLVGEGAPETSADRMAGGYDRAVVVSVASGQELWTLDVREMRAPAGRALVGLVAVGVGDVDGGGLPDIAVQAIEHVVGDRVSVVPSPRARPKRDQILRVQVWSGETKRLLADRGIGPGRFGGPLPLHAAGDVDGDGACDVILGFDGSFRQADGGPMPDPALVLSGCNGATILEAQDLGGWSICGPGDTDGDGYEDVLLGCGEALFHGKIRLLAGPHGRVRYDILGSHERGHVHFGYAVAPAGDLDGDGCADFVVGAPNPWSGTPGSASVFSGRSGALIFVITPEAVIADWRTRTDSRPR